MEALPRSKLVLEGSRLRKNVVVKLFPDSGLAKFCWKLLEEDWDSLEGERSSLDIVTQFEAGSER